MEKNDYFVIAYRILDYFYECLKAGIDPNMEEISAARLGIPAKYRLFVIEALLEIGCIRGIRVSAGTQTMFFDEPMITRYGIEYLYFDPKMVNAARFLTELACE